MGISRRKAGTVVQCPRCAGQVIVPDPDPHPRRGNQKRASKEPAAAVQSSDKPKDSQNSAGEIFERSDIGKLLQQEPIAYDPPQKAVPSSNGGFASAALEPRESLQRPSPPAGIVLTPFRMTVVAVGMVLVLGLAFFAGFLVGRSP